MVQDIRSLYIYVSCGALNKDKPKRIDQGEIKREKT
jgi:hypothetical protein